MPESLPDPSPFDENTEMDTCVDALSEALSMLKAAETTEGSPSLAEIMRLVRLMENQPEHAISKLRASLNRWVEDVPTPEKIRRAGLKRLGHSETSLKSLGGAERDAIESAIADEIRRHYGIAHLPTQRRSRPSPFSPHAF